MRKTHIPSAVRPLRTLCGKSVEGPQITLIRWNQSVDEATCLSCQRADDALVIRNHRRECAEAGIDPDTMEKIK